MAGYGKANREAVQTLINNMRSFNDIVDREITAMISRTDQLGESWRDAQYTQFKNFISDLSEALRRDLTIVAQTADTLQERVNKY